MCCQEKKKLSKKQIEQKIGILKEQWEKAWENERDLQHQKHHPDWWTLEELQSPKDEKKK